MEARRQQVAQKKADEDKAREEKRVKDEEERRRREKEKEDATEKRALKQPGKKVSSSILTLIYILTRYNWLRWRRTKLRNDLSRSWKRRLNRRLSPKSFCPRTRRMYPHLS